MTPRGCGATGFSKGGKSMDNQLVKTDLVDAILELRQEVERRPWLERPERLALDNRLLHKARPHLLRRTFRLRNGLGLSLGFLARRRIDFCFNDFERPDGGEQFVELVHGDIIFVGLKASLDLLAQFENGVDQIRFHQLIVHALAPFAKASRASATRGHPLVPTGENRKGGNLGTGPAVPIQGQTDVNNLASCRASGGSPRSRLRRYEDRCKAR